MNCRSSRRNELEHQGVRSAALNAWFGHSQAVAERHYEKVTEDDNAEVTNQSGVLRCNGLACDVKDIFDSQ